MKTKLNLNCDDIEQHILCGEDSWMLLGYDDDEPDVEPMMKKERLISDVIDECGHELICSMGFELAYDDNDKTGLVCEISGKVGSWQLLRIHTELVELCYDDLDDELCNYPLNPWQLRVGANTLCSGDDDVDYQSSYLSMLFGWALAKWPQLRRGQ